MTKRDELARAICCPQGCVAPPGSRCIAGNSSKDAATLASVLAVLREPSPEMIEAVRAIGGPQWVMYANAIWPTMIDSILGEPKS